MKNQTIAVDFPSDILLALNESESDLKKRVKLILAIQLYKLQKLTIGKNLPLGKQLSFQACQGLNSKMNFRKTKFQFQTLLKKIS